MKTKKQPYEEWSHPCDRQDVRAFVFALAALEKLRRENRLRRAEYAVWRREFLFGLEALLRSMVDDYFREHPIEAELRGRRQKRRSVR
jgi:hypothetical protein